MSPEQPEFLRRKYWRGELSIWPPVEQSGNRQRIWHATQLGRAGVFSDGKSREFSERYSGKRDGVGAGYIQLLRDCGGSVRRCYTGESAVVHAGDTDDG